jgi:hypothetical protein
VGLVGVIATLAGCMCATASSEAMPNNTQNNTACQQTVAHYKHLLNC